MESVFDKHEKRQKAIEDEMVGWELLKQDIVSESKAFAKSVAKIKNRNKERMKDLLNKIIKEMQSAPSEIYLMLNWKLRNILKIL